MSRRPIRALFVVPDLRVGGAERHVTTLLPRMDPERFTPSLICLGAEGDLYPEVIEAGVDATALRLRKRQAVRALCTLVATLRRTRPDVVVMRGYNAETLGRIAARIAGVKHTIVWAHNIGDARPRGRVRAWLDRILEGHTSRYFGVAELQRDYLTEQLRYPADKIRIVHNGVDPARFAVDPSRAILAEFGFDPTDRVVAIVAALRPEKDHETFLWAARRVVDVEPTAKFLVVGDGPMRTRLETLCGDLELTANVHFAGARGDIARLLAAIDVFVLSSITVECFPIALLEAMASARPAVCTAVGGIPEIVRDGETGYLVPPNDSVRLSGRILDLLSNPSVAKEFGRAGRARVEQEFTLDRSVNKAQEAIEDVVNGCLVTY